MLGVGTWRLKTVDFFTRYTMRFNRTAKQRSVDGS
jgi:hypothetical protein